MKLCKDCKYSSDDREYSICQRTIKPKISPVTGVISLKNVWSCDLSRSCSFVEVFLFKTCGGSGKYWEHK
jgi:hypothetical protein